MSMSLSLVCGFGGHNSLTDLQSLPNGHYLSRLYRLWAIAAYVFQLGIYFVVKYVKFVDLREDTSTWQEN